MEKTEAKQNDHDAYHYRPFDYAMSHNFKEKLTYHYQKMKKLIIVEILTIFSNNSFIHHVFN